MLRMLIQIYLRVSGILSVILKCMQTTTTRQWSFKKVAMQYHPQGENLPLTSETNPTQSKKM